MRKRLSFLLILLLAFNSTMVYGEDNVVHIRSINDWKQLAKDCIVDSYSKGITVSLDNDLLFEDNFVSIPYFNGTFNGNNHVLKGINLDSDESNVGIFRITGKDSLISDLNISFSVDSEGTNVGFVGYNQGKIESINVKGNVSAIDNVGIVVGYNSVNGSIINCTSNGKTYGKHYVGGIVGLNYGLIKNCTNNAYINNEVKDDVVDINTISIESLTSTENVASVTDLGGIAGSNFGVLKDSYNYGTVGYEHVGYNVGGVCGSSSGYVYNSVNNANIFGRKEVGGIVGQFEPAMSLNFNEDYLQSMRRQINNVSSSVDSAVNEVKNINDTNYDGLNSMANSLKEASGSVDTLLKSGFTFNEESKKLERSDEYEVARAALSSSLSNVFSTMEGIADANMNSGTELNSSLKNVNSSLQSLSNTVVNFSDSITNDKFTFEDVSLQDSDDIVEGKIRACNNLGDVDGDINVGGIVGAMARENDLDPEDDYTISGQTSLNATYKIRAVINDCVNNGKVTLKKNNAGGIAGNQDLGVIKNSINYGLLNCDGANYIGGIVGKSISNVNNNYAKCFIFGSDYVGGIAGSGSKLEGNGSLAQIKSGDDYVGSILGDYSNSDNTLVEDSEDIKNNYYLYEDYGAIDGISYTNKAYLISDDDFLNSDVSDGLKKVYVYFYNDKNLVSKKTLNYNDSLSLSEVPDVSDKENDYGSWNSLVSNELKNITKDLMFDLEFTNVYPSISSDEEPLALIVALGSFVKGDKISAVTSSKSNNEITYTYTLDIADSSSVDSLRVYANNYSDYDVYVNDQKVNYTVDGSYFDIVYNDDFNSITVKKKANYSYLIYVGIGVVGIIIVGGIITKKKNMKKESE